MRNKEETTKNNRQPCPVCGGSGQFSQFKGVSRFLLSVEECPECAGLGYILFNNGSSKEGAPEPNHD